MKMFKFIKIIGLKFFHSKQGRIITSDICVVVSSWSLFLFLLLIFLGFFLFLSSHPYRDNMVVWFHSCSFSPYLRSRDVERGWLIARWVTTLAVEVSVKFRKIFTKICSNSWISERCERKGTSKHICEAEHYPKRVRCYKNDSFAFLKFWVFTY